MSKKTVKFRARCFEGYGLNKFRNFMSAPECECGCGGKGYLVLETEEDLFGAMHGILADHDCNQCAIFAHAYNDEMYAAIKLSDVEEYDGEVKECPINFLGVKKTDMDFFRELDAEFCLHCYGLMIQRHDGTWEIIEE